METSGLNVPVRLLISSRSGLQLLAPPYLPRNRADLRCDTYILSLEKHCQSGVYALSDIWIPSIFTVTYDCMRTLRFSSGACSCQRSCLGVAFQIHSPLPQQPRHMREQKTAFVCTFWHSKFLDRWNSKPCRPWSWETWLSEVVMTWMVGWKLDHGQGVRRRCFCGHGSSPRR
jgi:hypothetical protein